MLLHRNDTLFVVLQGVLQVTNSKGDKICLVESGDRFGETKRKQQKITCKVYYLSTWIQFNKHINITGESDVLKPRKQRMSLRSLACSELQGISSDTLKECTRDFPIVQKRFRSWSQEIDTESISPSLFQANWDDNQVLIHVGRVKWERPKEERRMIVVLRWCAYGDRLLLAASARDVSLRLQNRIVSFAHSMFKDQESPDSSPWVSEEDESEACQRGSPPRQASWEEGVTPPPSLTSENLSSDSGLKCVFEPKLNEKRAAVRGAYLPYSAHEIGTKSVLKLEKKISFIDERVMRLNIRLIQLQQSLADLLWLLGAKPPVDQRHREDKDIGYHSTAESEAYSSDSDSSVESQTSLPEGTWPVGISCPNPTAKLTLPSVAALSEGGVEHIVTGGRLNRAKGFFFKSPWTCHASSIGKNFK
jgi:hypothetical protein